MGRKSKYPLIDVSGVDEHLIDDLFYIEDALKAIRKPLKKMTEIDRETTGRLLGRRAEILRAIGRQMKKK